MKPIPSPVPFVATWRTSTGKPAGFTLEVSPRNLEQYTRETGRPGAAMYPYAARGRTPGAALVAVLEAVSTGDKAAVAQAVLEARAPGSRREHSGECACAECPCACHRDGEGVGGLDGDQARHRERACSCRRCDCACHK